MTVLYILLAVVVLLVMVTIHELGHYIVGKILKFKIKEFSIGFGPAIFSKTNKKTGEKFSLRIFPLGGYCAFDGEDDDDEPVKKAIMPDGSEAVVNADTSAEEATQDASEDLAKTEKVADKPREGSFYDQKPWKRILVLLGGVTANFLSAILFSWILLCANGYDVPKIASVNTNLQTEVGVEYVVDYPFEVGDVITHIGGKEIDFAFGGNYVSLVNAQRNAAIKQYQIYYDANGKTLPTDNLYTFEMTVKRDGKVENLTITVYPKLEAVETSEKDEEGNPIIKYSVNGLIGLESAEGEDPHTVPYKYGFWGGLGRSFEMAFGFAWVVLKSLFMLLTFQVPIKQMTGTIGTIATMATMASQSLSYFLIFMPLIAANLAIFNLLPIPALDGCQVLFTTIEWIRGKPINRKTQSMINFVGLCVLLGFVVVIDILHFVL